MEKPTIDPKSLEVLRSRLEHGDVKRIARRLGLSRTTITKALSGEIRNLNVIKEAVKVAEENEKTFDYLNEILGK